MQRRRAQSDWNEERAYDVTLKVTGDVMKAEDARNAVTFAKNRTGK